MAWYDSAAFYHIYPLGLCGVDKENDYTRKESCFKELNLWVEHMKNMGFGAVYIGPLFESKTHGYDTTDYKKVDSRLGTNEDFRRWVQLCHEADIKVVVDGVFNHTGRDFMAFKNLQEKKWDSWGKDWYCWVDFNNRSPLGDDFSYECWRGYPELPKLNHQNPAVGDYLLEVVEYWVDAFDIDGIRLDCADVLDFNFMKRLRNRCDQLKENFWLMGEVIHGDYSRWVNREMLHSVTNYELHKGIYSSHNSHNYFEIAHTINRLFGEDYGICKGARLYNFVDNHDVDRIASKLDNKKNLYPVYTFLFTILGIPSVYYGSEWGIEGRKANGSDDPLRPKIGINNKPDNSNLASYIQNLCTIRRSHPELCEGKYRELLLTNRQYAYARILGNKACIVLLNNDEAETFMDVAVPIMAFRGKDLMTGEIYPVNNGRIQVKVMENSGAIIELDGENADEA